MKIILFKINYRLAAAENYKAKYESPFGKNLEIIYSTRRLIRLLTNQTPKILIIFKKLDQPNRTKRTQTLIFQTP